VAPAVTSLQKRRDGLRTAFYVDELPFSLSQLLVFELSPLALQLKSLGFEFVPPQPPNPAQVPLWTQAVPRTQRAKVHDRNGWTRIAS
jgi:hypothetical protein